MGPSLITIKLLAVVAALAVPAAGQGTGGAASCTASVITSFTPCLNFLTNSTNGGGSAPPQDCCRSLASLMSAGTGCVCLVLTGGVPLGAAVNRTLAVSLPKACNSSTVPLQCSDTSSAQTPAAPGAVADTPSGPATPETEAPTPPVDPAATAPAVSQGETRPAVLPSSAWRASADGHAAAAVALLLAVGAALV